MLDVLHPILPGLAVYAVDQVQVEDGEVGVLDRCDGRIDVAGRLGAGQMAQVVGQEALHTHADTVDGLLIPDPSSF